MIATDYIPRRVLVRACDTLKCVDGPGAFMRWANLYTENIMHGNNQPTEKALLFAYCRDCTPGFRAEMRGADRCYRDKGMGI